MEHGSVSFGFCDVVVGTGTVEVRVDMKRIKTMQFAGVRQLNGLSNTLVETDGAGAPG